MKITKESLLSIGLEEVLEQEQLIYTKYYIPYGSKREYLFAVGIEDNFYVACIADKETAEGLAIKRIDTIKDVQSLYYVLSGDSLTNKT